MSNLIELLQPDSFDNPTWQRTPPGGGEMVIGYGSLPFNVETTLMRMNRGPKAVSQPGYAPKRAFVWAGTPKCWALPKHPGWTDVTAKPSGEPEAVATAGELAEVLEQINELLYRVEADELGLVRPSVSAFRQCQQIILALARAGELVPPTDIGTDPAGAIRISWASDERESELIFPFEETEVPYLYYSSPDDYGIERRITSDAIAQRIGWAFGN